MEQVWIIFVSSGLLLAIGLRNFWRRRNDQVVLDFKKQPVPWQFDAMGLFLGVIGLVSTVPGLFFDQPHWAMDHVWYLVSKL